MYTTVRTKIPPMSRNMLKYRKTAQAQKQLWAAVPNIFTNGLKAIPRGSKCDNKPKNSKTSKSTLGVGGVDMLNLFTIL